MAANSAHTIPVPGTRGPARAATASPQPAAPRPGQAGPAGGLRKPVVALTAVIMFQLLFASVFLGVLHRPALHHAAVGVVGTSPVAAAVSRQGDGAIDLVREPTVQAAQARIRDGRLYAAVVAAPRGESLLIETAASPGTASALTKGFTAAATAMKVPLQVRDLAPLPPADPAGTSAFFLVAGWVLGGYVGTTVLGLTLGMRSKGLRQAALRLGLLAAYATVSGFAGALLFGPGLGVMSGFSAALAGVGILVVFAAATATAALQGALGMPGTLIAILGMVVFGNPTAGQSIATPLLASPWNVIGQVLPPGAGLSSARSVIYLGGVNLTGPFTVLSGYAVAGTLVTLAAAAWRRHKVAAA
jgi:hypothetical protein